MNYEHAGTFVVRSPLLPFSTVDGLDTGTAAIEAYNAGQPLDDAVNADRATLAANLTAFIEDPVVREAVWLASPSLDERLGEGDDLVRPLLSYVTRMAMRATPFGMFAGCSAGTIGGPMQPLALPPRSAVKRETRLDFGFLAAVVAAVAGDPQTRAALTYVPNTGRYQAGGRLRLAEARIDENRRVRYHRVTFEEDEALTETLDRARGGARLRDLAAGLVDGDITIEEAEEYVGDLVAAQLLVPSLGPPVTGDSAVERMVAALRSDPATTPTADALAEAHAELKALDAAGPGQDRGRYLDLADKLRKIDPDLRTDRLFQVDVSLGGPAPALPDAVLRDARKATDVLRRIARVSPEDEFAKFRENFMNRYEDRVVPLAEVLDEEVGIGFGPAPALSAEGAPLLAGVPGRMARQTQQFSAADGYLLRLLARGPVVELTEEDLKALAAEKEPTLPDAVSVTVSLAAHGEDDYRVIVTAITGPSGARLLGRFCHVDPGIEQLVRDHCEAEQALRPDAVFAEIVHLPEGRIGNILARPVLRPYEIEFLGTSGAEGTLPFDDLLVSVQGERIVLWSRSLDKEVIPRLTSAHNHVTGALAPYRFLAALQYQGVHSTLRWSWGVLESAAAFLPRVTHGRLVLSRAQWQPSPKDMEPLREAKTPAEKFAAAQKLRESLSLPRHVVVAMGDNELPVDLDRVGGAELLAHEASRGGLRLVELYPGPDELYATSPDGPRAHEIVVPLVRTGTPAPSQMYAAPAAEDTFPPGSEWLTAKLYCGPASADTVLREAVAPFVRETALDGWFFIRYSDPDNHLRVRFHAPPERLWGEVLPAFKDALTPLLGQGVVRRVLLDTYRREVSRYGGPEAIIKAERFFQADSEAVLSVLAVAGGDEGLDLRWRLAVAGTDRLLADAGLGVAERRALVKAQRDGYVAEQGPTGDAAKRRSGKLFRDERGALNDLLDGNAGSPALQVGLAALDRRSEIAREVLREVPPRSLGSHIHMHVNRMLRAAQRTQELVVLDLLDRLYAARIARST